MPDLTVRPAIAADQDTIKHMVRNEGLDPTALHWSHFIVAEDGDKVAGIGQVRPYPRCRELGSLVVLPEYRKRGVGSLIVNTLLAQEKGEVYLECGDYNEPFYTKLGFQSVPFWKTPWPLNFKAGLVKIVGRFINYRLVTMRHSAG